MDHREMLKGYVAEALARRAGLPMAKAAAIVEESAIGALRVGNLNFLSFKGPDYWADRILESLDGDKTAAPVI